MMTKQRESQEIVSKTLLLSTGWTHVSMPPRIGPNGAVVKPSSSTNDQRTARTVARKIIDLTRDSTDDASETSQGEESAAEEESEDAPERYNGRSSGGRGHQESGVGTQERTSGAGQATAGRPRTNDQQGVVRRGEQYIMEDSFVVTSLHHRPWGAGDDNATIGMFATEEEAKIAAEMHFKRVASGADGWESEWRQRPGDGMRQLCGVREEGEKDTERYTASIKWFQQKRPIAVQPIVPSAPEPKIKIVKPRHVYVVKQEQRETVGEDDPRGFNDDLGDLKAVTIHGIYVDLDTANESAREIYDGVVEDLDDEAETITDTLRHGMATIVVENHMEMTTYAISVEKRSLK